MAAFFIYTGLEAATGAWVYSLFTEARAIPMPTAGLWVSIYWGSLTVGRFVFGLAANWTLVHRLLRLCIINIALGAALVWLSPTHTLSFLGLALIGFASGPIFPSLIASTPERLGAAHVSNAVGFQIAAAALGQSLLPALMGMLAHHLSLEIIGPALLTAALLLLVVYVLLSGAAGGRTQPRTNPLAAPAIPSP